MAGGLLQLVAYGAQDIYLTGNPQITFFKIVYRRHTNFSMECVEQVFSGTPNFGRKAICTITRNGDLVTRMYLMATLPKLSKGHAWCRRVGYSMLKSVEVEIGGTKIDKHYGNWLNIWHELTHDPNHDRAHDKMIGNTDEICLPSSDDIPQTTLYVPLEFWFNRNTGLALPLIALQYHEVRVEFEFETVANLVCSDDNVVENRVPLSESLAMVDSSLLVDYIYLDSEERRRFAQVGHEYLIEQLQGGDSGADSVNQTTHKTKLNLNHPVKELIWVLKKDSNTRTNKYLAHPRSVDRFNEAAVALVKHLCNDPAGTEQDGDGTVTVGGASTQITIEYAGGEKIKVGRHVGSNNQVSVALCNKIVDAVVVVGGGNEVTVVSVTHTLGSVDLRHPAGLVTYNDLLSNSVHPDGLGNPLADARLQLNGHDRFDTRNGDYFNLVQPWQHHTRTPSDGVNLYSFALKPEEHQPSGSCNMSRIDNATLNLNFTHDDPSKLLVYAVNYNVLRVMSGMGGLAYSN